MTLSFTLEIDHVEGVTMVRPREEDKKIFVLCCG